MADYVRMVRRKDQLRQKLAALVPTLNEEINAANEANATELAGVVRKRAPRSPGAPSKGPHGHYADSIVARPIDDDAKRADQVITSRVRPKGGGKTKTVRAEGTLAWGLFAYFWWRWLEFGTRKMSAQPHIMPTYRSMKKRFKSRMSRAVRKAVKKAGGK